MMDAAATTDKFGPLHDALCNAVAMLLASPHRVRLNTRDIDALEKMLVRDRKWSDVDDCIHDRDLVHVEFVCKEFLTSFTFTLLFKKEEDIIKDDGSAWATYRTVVTVTLPGHGWSELEMTCKRLAFYNEIVNLALSIQLSLPKKFEVCLRTPRKRLRRPNEPLNNVRTRTWKTLLRCLAKACAWTSTGTFL